MGWPLFWMLYGALQALQKPLGVFLSGLVGRQADCRIKPYVLTIKLAMCPTPNTLRYADNPLTTSEKTAHPTSWWIESLFKSSKLSF